MSRVPFGIRRLDATIGGGAPAGSVVLVLFVLSQLTNAAVGPSGYLLMMTGHQDLTMFNQLFAGTLNVVLNYLLILELGFIGAAVATASILSLVNVVRVFEVWYLERLQPYAMNFFKPIGAAVCAGGTMYLFSWVLAGYILLFTGGAVGVVVFSIVLYALGIEQDDRHFFEQLVEQL